MSFTAVALPLVAAMLILFQVNPDPGKQLTPEQIPAWFYLALVPAAGWFAKDFFPWVAGFVSAEVRERRAAKAQTIKDQDDRLITAMETSAQALNKSADASLQIAIAMRTMADVRVADNLTLQRLERRMDEFSRQGNFTIPKSTRPDLPKNDGE